MAQIESPKARVLVVDDEAGARSALVELLRDEGFEVRSAADGFKAIGQLEDFHPDLLMTDVQMPGMDGIELMGKVRDRERGIGVIVMTAFGSVENAVKALQEGANDYLTKPLHFPELLAVVDKVLEHRDLQQENARLRGVIEAGSKEDDLGFVARSKAARGLLATIRQVASADASVLVVGEPGSGKELVASALHQASDRKDKPFVTVQCASLEPQVLESELFGHEAGAVVGIATARDGAVSRADGGTLFLDGVDECPPAVQIKLLKFLQDGSYTRLGSEGERRADVRVVSATDHDLHAKVESGDFRDDLLYRLNVITLRTPTLRERREDLPLLAMEFATTYAAKNHKIIRGFTDRALAVLLHFDWPGNVRQLEHCIERAVVMSKGREIEPRDLPRELMAHMRTSADTPQIPGASMAEIEKFAILTTLEHTGGSTGKAAEILGISPRKIQYRLSEYRQQDPSSVPGQRRSAPASN